MDNRKIIETVVSVVAIVWIFCISLMVSLKVAHGKRDDSSLAMLSTSAPETTVASTEQSNAVSGTTMKRVNSVGNAVSIQASVGDPQWKLDEEASKKAAEESKKASEKAEKDNTTRPQTAVPSGKQEIINAYINGVNKLKKEQNFTLKKNDELNIYIDEITGGNGIKDIGQDMIDKNKPVPESFTFVGGVDSATGQGPNAVIAPLNVNASVNPDAVTSATAQADSAGGYTLKLAFIDETQTYNESSGTTPAPNLSTMVEVIDVNELLGGGVSIKEISFLYTGTTIEAHFNKDNKITSMKHYLNVSQCSGVGSLDALPFVTANVSIHGDFTSNYTVVYS